MSKPTAQIVVRVRFFHGWREWRGYKSCSPYFHIAKPPQAGWDIIHVPSGLCKRHCRTRREARLFCGIYGALPVNWKNTGDWAKWQKRHRYLMPWFKASGQVMHAIG